MQEFIVQNKITIIGMAILGGPFILMMVYNWISKRHEIKILTPIAALYNAALDVSETIFLPRDYRFIVNEYDVPLYISAKKNKRRKVVDITKVFFSLQTDKTFNCSITPEIKTLDIFEKHLFEVKDIQTGNPLFDKKFFVRANDETLMLHILTSTIQEKLLEQSSFSIYFGRFTDDLGPFAKLPKAYTFRLYTHEFITSGVTYDWMIDLTYHFYQELKKVHFF